MRSTFGEMLGAVILAIGMALAVVGLPALLSGGEEPSVVHCTSDDGLSPSGESACLWDGDNDGNRRGDDLICYSERGEVTCELTAVR